MITRYRISFEDRLIEPDTNGKWVKYEDVAEIEASAQTKAEEIAQESQKLERIDLGSKTQQVAELTQSRNALEEELASQNRLNEHQAYLIKAARDRLALHGHTPNCASRYGKKVAGGHQIVEACDCELDEWMHKSGMIHG